MRTVTGSPRCRWCGSELKTSRVAFCAECKGPNTVLSTIAYLISFTTKALAIPLAIAYVTYRLTTQQQDASQIIASRQKLADAVIEYSRNYGELHAAGRQIALLATSKADTLPAAMVREAVVKFDSALSSFGARLIPFEEFVRRNKNAYKNLRDDEPTPLQQVWDECFVYPYWIDSPSSPSYISQIDAAVSECDNTSCPISVAVRLNKIDEKIYDGFCHDGKPGKSINFIWFDRELKRIVIQASRNDPFGEIKI